MAILQRLLATILGLVVVTTIAGAILIMVSMDRGSISQGGRIYVAIAALVVLGVVDTQVRRLLARRMPFTLTTAPWERRYALISLLALLVCCTVLVGLALLLP